MANIRNHNLNPCVQILGSTGSIGTQALDVAKKHGYRVMTLCAGTNVKAAEDQAREFHPKALAMTDADAASALKTALADTDVKVYAGMDGLCEMIRTYGYTDEGRTVVLNAIAGGAGLLPSLAALEASLPLALANKESLVMAGSLVMDTAARNHVPVLPVDSEHCAIFQCLKAGQESEIGKLILTASGGPFFGMSRKELEKVDARAALAHPTWHMGAQITIDSATLMNKGFEVIEAAHLFRVDESQIKVLVHRESIVHSMVEFIDHSVIAQLSVPDMRFCIAHAIEYPERRPAVIPELSLSSVGCLHFDDPDTETFTLLNLARKAYRLGGAFGAVLNASNEVAVDAFLKGQIGFLDISRVVETVFDSMKQAGNAHSLEDILSYDRLSREVTEACITGGGTK